MPHALVRTTSRSASISLYELCQLYTECHIRLIDDFKDERTLRRTRIVAGIVLLIVILKRNHLILSFGRTKLFVTATHTHRIGLHARNGLFAGQGIGMDRNEHIGFISVGNGRTLVKRYKHIGLARIDDSHVGAVALYIFSESQCHGQIDIFLLSTMCAGTGILAAMTSINDQRISMLCSRESYCKTTHHD